MDWGVVERELCRIPEVRAARVVTDDNGHPVEVHILATTSKAAKQLVRDVQSVAIAAAGIGLDHRIVSIVQLDDADGTAAEPSPAPASGDRATASRLGDRLIVGGVLVARQDTRSTASVTLRRGDDVVVGTAEGTVASSARWRLVAEAALHALGQLEPDAAQMSVEVASVQRVGHRDVGIVTLILVIPPNEELLAGAAPVRGGAEDEAVARAVLDATNRRLVRVH